MNYFDQAFSDFTVSVSSKNQEIKKEKTEIILRLVTSNPDFDILKIDPSKALLLLKKFPTPLSEISITSFSDQAQENLYAYCLKFSYLEDSSELKERSFPFICVIMTEYFKVQPRYSIMELIKNFIFINAKIDYTLAIKYLGDITHTMTLLQLEAISEWWDFLFENILGYFYNYDENIQPTESFNLEYRTAITSIFVTFIKTLIEKNSEFNPFATDKEKNLTGIISILENFHFDDFSSIMMHYYPCDVMCSNPNFENESTTKYFLPCAYQCKYDSSLTKVLINIIGKTSVKTNAKAINLMINITKKCLSLEDEQRVIKIVSIFTCLFDLLFANNKEKENLFENLFSIIDHSPHSVLNLFSGQMASGCIEEKIVKKYWQLNCDKQVYIMIAKILATHFFACLLKINISNLVAFSKNYHSSNNKARDKRLSPYFLEKINLLEIDQTAYFSTVFQWPKFNIPFFLTSIRIDAADDEKVMLVKNFLRAACENKDYDFIRVFNETMFEVINNLPSEFKFDLDFINSFLIPEILFDKNFIAKCDLAVIEPVFKNPHFISDKNFDLFIDFLKTLSNSKIHEFRFLLFLASNVNLIDTKFECFIDYAILMIEKIKNTKIPKPETILISGFIFSLYSILYSKNDEKRVQLISYLNDLCVANKSFNMVHEQVLAHFLGIFDEKIRESIKTETLIMQIDGCPKQLLTYLHVLMSDKTNIENAFPDFNEKMFNYLINVLKHEKDDRVEFIASLLVDILLKKQNLFSTFCDETKDIENQEIITDIKDSFISKVIATNCTTYPTFVNPQIASYNEKLVVFDELTNDSMKLYCKKSNSLCSYKITIDEMKSQQKMAIDKMPKCHDLYVQNIPNFAQFISGYQATFKSNEISFMPVTDFSLQPAKSEGGFQVPSALNSNSTEDEVEEKPFEFVQMMPKNAKLIYSSIFDQPFSVENPSQSLLRECRSLFEVPDRGRSKIGILYIKKDKIQQGEILTVENTSNEYEEFLHGIGEFVNLKGFKRYNGKLDIQNNRNGAQSVYFEDLRIETMFHIPTMMPTKEGDSQQLQKKKHVGNDNVMIVWNENNNIQWNMSTIVSQFNDLHVVVFQHSNSLLFVDVRKKNESY